jgi:hypothetical protein
MKKITRQSVILSVIWRQQLMVDVMEGIQCFQFYFGWVCGPLLGRLDGQFGISF